MLVRPAGNLSAHRPLIMPKNTIAPIPQAGEITAQVLRGIAGNRIPGLHFAGYFLDMALPRIDGDEVVMSVPHAPHTCDDQGVLDLTALCMLADSSLATATRNQVAAGARLATLHLQLQFTGLPATSAATSTAQPLGAFAATAVQQLLASATIATSLPRSNRRPASPSHRCHGNTKHRRSRPHSAQANYWPTKNPYSRPAGMRCAKPPTNRLSSSIFGAGCRYARETVHVRALRSVLTLATVSAMCRAAFRSVSLHAAPVSPRRPT